MMSKEPINQDTLSKHLLTLSPEEGLAFLCQAFEGKVAFSTSFGQEDQVITDMIGRAKLPVRIFTLDTGRLFQETYELMDSTTTRYKIDLETYFPDTESTQELVRKKGFHSFYESVENRKECCRIRKIMPLKRALADTKIWITGLRAEQSENRQSMEVLENDNNFGVLKYNPLIDWSYEKVLDYLKTNKVPDNPLHRKGFISIGCQPCTRAIEAGEHPRAGRWWWENSQKECGLHQ